VFNIGIILVEICNLNALKDVHLAEIEESSPLVSVIQMECLNSCGLCTVAPFALVNGKRVFGKTLDKCITKINQQIQKELDVLFQRKNFSN